MSLAAAYSRVLQGMNAPEVVVEVMLSNGLPGISIIGLPEAAVREAKDRVRGALISAGYKLPQRKVTINLAPADLPKSSSRLDLPIAIGILAASGQIDASLLDGYDWIGELALDGTIRPVHGVLPIALKTRDQGRRLVLPEKNAEEAAHVTGLEMFPVRTLSELVAHLLNGPLPAVEIEKGGSDQMEVMGYPDLAQIKGQPVAKRALEITAAGGHNLLMSGPPGTGKTLLASALPGILPRMSEQEALESAAVHSISTAEFDPMGWRRRVMRTPHHTASAASLVGGGSQPRPGEVSLSHHGVLFLDELPEFSRNVLEVLREPMESGRITISRASAQLEFPARFQLVAAMNPCPCGYHGDYSAACRCSAEQIQRYRYKISGPLLDRIDLQIEVARIPPEVLTSTALSAEPSRAVRERVEQAREIQVARQGEPNGQLEGNLLERYCALDTEGKQFVTAAIASLGLSARAYHRVLRVARTVADLAGVDSITIDHLSEAISFRKIDRVI